MTKRKTILISDEHHASLNHQTNILKKMGFFVVPVQDCLEVIKTVSNLLPNLIILSVGSPDHDGIRVIRHLKSSRPTSSIPVVVVSGDGSEETKKEYDENGCDAFVKKPLELRDLHDILQQFIYLPEGYTRQYLRVDVNFIVKVTKEDETCLMNGETLSEKGIYIANDSPYPVNTWVFVDLLLEGGDSVRLNGRVIYICEEPGIGFSRGMAVEFVENDDDTMDRVREYVQSTLDATHTNQ